jgi:hypothetical protein
MECSGSIRSDHGPPRNVQERSWNTQERSGTIMEHPGTFRDVQERSWNVQELQGTIMRRPRTFRNDQERSGMSRNDRGAPKDVQERLRTSRNDHGTSRNDHRTSMNDHGMVRNDQDDRTVRNVHGVHNQWAETFTKSRSRSPFKIERTSPGYS